MSSLEDAISILGCFSLSEPSLSQAEVARRTGCPKSTASRVMKTLRESGILDFDAVTRLYTPGIRLFELGQICRSNHNFLDLVNTELEEVCSVGGHTAYVTVFDGPQLVVLRMVRGSSPLAITSTPGYRAWPHATSNGRAMLSLLDEEEWKLRVPDQLPFVTPRAPQNHEELLERIRIIQETGRSHSTNDSYDGVSSEGIAFRDPGTDEVIGVAISYPTTMGTPELQDKITGLLTTMKTNLMRHK
ncbi:IclR family transcriptional regulator [Neorhizobium vignae]|uniref:IclR family transcriptional regulator n=1 Tax=Neorhizobium vignae TaxID=690585 RepID=UPI00056B8714|nr:IclR family transcriptional regulator [Neorhizobium vignae]